MRLEIKSLYFLVESGPALDLAKQIAANYQDVHDANVAYVKSIGGVAFQTDWEGRACSVKFDGDAPAGFKKPNKKGCCEPKKGSQFAADMARLPVQIKASHEISKLLNVPTSLEHKRDGWGSGWTSMGHPFFPCGILYYNPDGPFCFWTPDVERHVALAEADGSTVEEPAKSYKPGFEGIRQILEEEWDLMRARYKADHGTR